MLACFPGLPSNLGGCVFVTSSYYCATSPCMRFFIWRTFFELSRFSKYVGCIAHAQTTSVNGLNYGRGQPCIAKNLIMILLAALLLFDCLCRLSKVILSPRSQKSLKTRLGQSRASVHFGVLHTNYPARACAARGKAIVLSVCRRCRCYRCR